MIFLCDIDCIGGGFGFITPFETYSGIRHACRVAIKKF